MVGFVRDPRYIYYVGKDGHIWGSPRKGISASKMKMPGTAIVRKAGYLYFVDKKGIVRSVKIKRRRKMRR